MKHFLMFAIMNRRVVICYDQKNMVDYKNVNYVLEETIYSVIHNITC